MADESFEKRYMCCLPVMFEGVERNAGFSRDEEDDGVCHNDNGKYACMSNEKAGESLSGITVDSSYC